jgi:RNA polymerase sigma-70 factor (ECF subfamily)
VPTDIGHLLSDHDLVASAQAGDPTALNTLISAARVAVFRYCRSRLASYSGGVEVAEDVTQDTCVALVDVLPRYQRQGAPFSAFVYAIAANKIADAQRRYGRSLLSAEEVPDQVESGPTPEEQVLISADVDAALELVGRLPQRMRQVLRLRALGLSVEAVAETTGMSAGAVRVTHHRATAKLRELIAASEEYRERFAGRCAGSNAA